MERHPDRVLAEVLVSYSTRVKPGELVCISGDPLAMPLIEAVYSRVLAAGGHPFWLPRSEELETLHLREASEEQLKYLSPLDMERVDKIDVLISLWAEVNTRATSRIDPKRVSIAQAAKAPMMKRFLQRMAEGQMRWCGTLYPTQAAAQDAERSLADYRDFVYRAGLLHLPDPVAAWKSVARKQAKVREFLQGKKVLRFRAPAADGHDGTNLTVDVSNATWISCAGTENFPDGEIFAGPTGVDGHVNYTFPAVHHGREVVGVRLAFKGGRVVDATAEKNEDFLIRMLELDAGARNLGEIAIGTNYSITEFTRNTLFDEKIGGTFHAAVGAGYPESGNSNESGLHWDMVCDLRPRAARDGSQLSGGTIEADGEVFHRDGLFLPSLDLSR